MWKKFVVCVLAVFMLSLTSCSQIHEQTVSKKTEYEKVAKIKEGGNIGTYDLNDWEKIYFLGIEGELVLLEKGDTVILADDPNVGNAIYEQGILEMGMELQGAGKYIRVKDLFGVESGIGTVRKPEDVRIGIAQNIGDPMKKDVSEMSDEEQDYIPISYWDWVQPPSTTD